ncbi:MAG TPA: hypothetical protein VNR87_05680 [Flavisolibacter sp.]|nr:hypothetical protein [Flavisolibacter sp.]
MKYGFVLLSSLLLLTSCKKNGTKKINAGNITVTDAMGQPVGPADPSDWRFDDGWSAAEQALFNFADTASTAGMKQAAATRAGAYPNPASERINFYFSTDQPTLLKMVITDERLNLFYKDTRRLNSSSGYNFTLDLASGAYKNGSFYRIYYALYAEGGAIYKRGHGDFKRS